MLSAADLKDTAALEGEIGDGAPVLKEHNVSSAVSQRWRSGC